MSLSGSYPRWRATAPARNSCSVTTAAVSACCSHWHALALHALLLRLELGRSMACCRDSPAHQLPAPLLRAAVQPSKAVLQALDQAVGPIRVSWGRMHGIAWPAAHVMCPAHTLSAPGCCCLWPACALPQLDQPPAR